MVPLKSVQNTVVSCFLCLNEFRIGLLPNTGVHTHTHTYPNKRRKGMRVIGNILKNSVCLVPSCLELTWSDFPHNMYYRSDAPLHSLLILRTDRIRLGLVSFQNWSVSFIDRCDIVSVVRRLHATSCWMWTLNARSIRFLLKQQKRQTLVLLNYLSKMVSFLNIFSDDDLLIDHIPKGLNCRNRRWPWE